MPGCSAYGDTLEEAAREIRDAQEAWLEACLASVSLCRNLPRKLEKQRKLTRQGTIKRKHGVSFEQASCVILDPMALTVYDAQLLRLYLDNCCFNRPYDDQLSLPVYLETQAKLNIQEQRGKA